MKIILAKIFKMIIPRTLIYRVSLLYMRLFNNNSYQAHQDYISTDYRQKSVHIMEALNYVKVSKLPKVFFEFGCHSGRTFSSAVIASKELGIFDECEFFAFDSFEGLPETTKDDGIFKKGTFSTGVNEFKSAVKKQADFSIKDKNIIIGFYSNSLTEDLQSKLPSVGVVHIDVDLYSSAIEVLRFIRPLLVSGSVLIFDDFYCFPAGSDQGENKALNEFLIENEQLKILEWKSYSSFGKSFFIVDTSDKKSINE